MSDPQPEKTLRIVIVEDEEIFVVGLMAVLGKDMEVVGCAQDPVHGLELVKKERPDLVLLDLRFPNSDRDGHWVLQQVSKLDPPPLVVVMSAFDTPELQSKVKRQGAVAFLHKLDPTDKMVATLQGLAKGLRPRFDAGDSAYHKLTSRELEIIKVLVETRDSDQAIGDRLGIQSNTISKSLSLIRLKLNLSNRADIVAWYLKAFPDTTR